VVVLPVELVTTPTNNPEANDMTSGHVDGVNVGGRPPLPPDYKPVPVDEAKRICEQYGKASVMIVSHDRPAACLHYTTYGMEASDKVGIAGCADWLSRALSAGANPLKRWEDFRHVHQAVYKQRIDTAVRGLDSLVEAMNDVDGPHRTEVVSILRNLMAVLLPAERPHEGGG
jgi:hypothetical protein